MTMEPLDPEGSAAAKTPTEPDDAAIAEPPAAPVVPRQIVGDRREIPAPDALPQKPDRDELARMRSEVTRLSKEVAAARDRANRAEQSANQLRNSRAVRLAALRHRLGFRTNPTGVLREAWQIVRGRPAADGAEAAAGAPVVGRTAAIRQALRAKDYNRATALIGRPHGGDLRDPEFLRLKRDTHHRRGELYAALEASQQLRRLTNTADHRAQERLMMGRILETDASWLPRIPGPPRRVDPRSDTTILHLLKESLPYHNNGFCMRSHYSLLAQREAGLEPVVVTSPGFPRRDGVLEFPPSEVIDDIPHHRIDVGYPAPANIPFDDYLRDYTWAAARLAHQIRPAVIHAGSGYRGYEAALVGRALRNHLRLPLVYEVRSFFETTWTGDADWAERGEHYERRFATENRCMQDADVVITIAEAMRQEVIDRGVAPERVFVIPNGVDAAVFTPRPRDRELVRQYGTDGVPTFGYVSNLDHLRENQETLIRATAVLKARGRTARCLIVGDGRRRGELEALARSEGVATEVIFTGKVPHAKIQDYYALLDVFVVPRMAERAARLVTPLKPYEAMAMALPCVVSELPALLEITGNAERGLSFPPEDAAALADRLIALFDNVPLREQLGRRGREWVLSERSWSVNGPRYDEVYRFALGEWKRTGGTLWK